MDWLHREILGLKNRGLGQEAKVCTDQKPSSALQEGARWDSCRKRRGERRETFLTSGRDTLVMAADSANPSIEDSEADDGFQDQPSLCSKFKASLGHRIPC